MLLLKKKISVKNAHSWDIPPGQKKISLVEILKAPPTIHRQSLLDKSAFPTLFPYGKLKRKKKLSIRHIELSIQTSLQSLFNNWQKTDQPALEIKKKNTKDSDVFLLPSLLTNKKSISRNENLDTHHKKALSPLLVSQYMAKLKPDTASKKLLPLHKSTFASLEAPRGGPPKNNLGWCSRPFSLFPAREEEEEKQIIWGVPVDQEKETLEEQSNVVFSNTFTKGDGAPLHHPNNYLGGVYNNNSFSFKEKKQVKKRKFNKVWGKGQNLYTSYCKLEEVKLITIGLASAEKIRQWAERTLPNGKVVGQVTNANTLHHKTFKPQKGGLFCERIFGPLKDFECACGKKQPPSSPVVGAYTEKASLPLEGKNEGTALPSLSPYPPLSPPGNRQEGLSLGGKAFPFLGRESKGRGLERVNISKAYASLKLVQRKNTFGEGQQGIRGLAFTFPPQGEQQKPSFCAQCDVQYTRSVVRRYQLGFIELVSPATHVWYLKGNPSYISILLDMKKKQLEHVTYCVETLTLENSLNSVEAFSNSPSNIFVSWQNLMSSFPPFPLVGASTPLVSASTPLVSASTPLVFAGDAQTKGVDALTKGVDAPTKRVKKPKDLLENPKTERHDPNVSESRFLLREPSSFPLHHLGGVYNNNKGIKDSSLPLTFRNEQREKKGLLFFKQLDKRYKSLTNTPVFSFGLKVNYYFPFFLLLFTKNFTKHTTFKYFIASKDFSYMYKYFLPNLTTFFNRKASKYWIEAFNVMLALYKICLPLELFYKDRKKGAAGPVVLAKLMHASPSPRSAFPRTGGDPLIKKRGALFSFPKGTKCVSKDIKLTAHTLYMRIKECYQKDKKEKGIFQDSNSGIFQKRNYLHIIPVPFYIFNKNIFLSCLLPEINRYAVTSEKMKKAILLASKQSFAILYKKAYKVTFLRLTNILLKFIPNLRKEGATFGLYGLYDRDVPCLESFKRQKVTFLETLKPLIDNLLELSTLNLKMLFKIIKKYFKLHVVKKVVLALQKKNYLDTHFCSFSPLTLNKERALENKAPPFFNKLEKVKGGEGILLFKKGGPLINYITPPQVVDLKKIGGKYNCPVGGRGFYYEKTVTTLLKKEILKGSALILESLVESLLPILTIARLNQFYKGGYRDLYTHNANSHIYNGTRHSYTKSIKQCFFVQRSDRSPPPFTGRGEKEVKSKYGSAIDGEAGLLTEHKQSLYYAPNYFFGARTGVLKKGISRLCSFLLHQSAHNAKILMQVPIQFYFKKKSKTRVTKGQLSFDNLGEIYWYKKKTIAPTLNASFSNHNKKIVNNIYVLSHRQLWREAKQWQLLQTYLGVGLNPLTPTFSSGPEHKQSLYYRTGKASPLVVNQETLAFPAPPFLEGGVIKRGLSSLCLFSERKEERQSQKGGMPPKVGKNELTLPYVSNLSGIFRSSYTPFLPSIEGEKPGALAGLYYNKKKSTSLLFRKAPPFFYRGKVPVFKRGGEAEYIFISPNISVMQVPVKKKTSWLRPLKAALLHITAFIMSGVCLNANNKKSLLFTSYYAKKKWQFVFKAKTIHNNAENLPIATYNSRLHWLSSPYTQKVTTSMVNHQYTHLSQGSTISKVALKEVFLFNQDQVRQSSNKNGSNPNKTKRSKPQKAKRVIYFMAPFCFFPYQIIKRGPPPFTFPPFFLPSPPLLASNSSAFLPCSVSDHPYKSGAINISGAGLIEKLLVEFDSYQLKKLDKQNRILLYELNTCIAKLKKKIFTKVIKKQLKQWCHKRDFLMRRTKLVRKMFRKDCEPSMMVLSLLPVLPPDLRPIVKIGGQIAASDLNRLYQRVIYRNDRLKKFLKDKATSHSYEMKYAQRLLQEAVDNLIQNGKSGVQAEVDSRGRMLKSLSDILKGKQGRFRQYLLGKRVDYSGRSVIVVAPKLKLHQCGLPKEMAIELYLPFLLKRILNENLAKTVVGAKLLIKTNKTLTWQLLREIMQVGPVLLNRAPTLHRLGFQAFQPKLVEGRAILLHPLVCAAFNADFDGDQMAVHIPITVEARAEAWKLMLSRNNLVSAATGEPIAIPSQDMILGCYYLTTNGNENAVAHQIGSSGYFSDLNDVLKAYNQQKIDVHAMIWVKWNGLVENSNLYINKPKIANINKGLHHLISSPFLKSRKKAPPNGQNESFNNFSNGVSSVIKTDPLISTFFPLVGVLPKNKHAKQQQLEIRVFQNGQWQEIHTLFFKTFSLMGSCISQYIRTTPGRILFNTLITKRLPASPLVNSRNSSSFTSDSTNTKIKVPPFFNKVEKVKGGGEAEKIKAPPSVIDFLGEKEGDIPTPFAQTIQTKLLFGKEEGGSPPKLASLWKFRQSRNISEIELKVTKKKALVHAFEKQLKRYF